MKHFGILDEKSQNTVLDILKQMKKNHTILIISHDKNVLKDSDRIIVLDEHKVSEIGTIKELKDNKGKYYEMFEKQTT